MVYVVSQKHIIRPPMPRVPWEDKSLTLDGSIISSSFMAQDLGESLLAVHGLLFSFVILVEHSSNFALCDFILREINWRCRKRGTPAT